MSTGLTTTFETLAASRNDAANQVLQAALKNADGELFDAAVKAILARRNKAGHLEVLKCWHEMSVEQQALVKHGQGRLSNALRDAILSDDTQLFANACEIVRQFREFDLVATLVTLSENQKSEHAKPATHLVVELVELLSEEVHGQAKNKRRKASGSHYDLVLESLERSIQRFRQHNRTELIEAYVTLAGPHNETLNQILDEPHHPCYLTVINTLTHSKATGVVKLLLEALRSDVAPLSILNVIGKRTDELFVSQLFECAGQELPTKVQKNLSRIRSFPWTQLGKHGFDSFDDQHQAFCVKIVAASGVKQDEFLDLLENIFKLGGPLARLSACEALAKLPGDRANHLVLQALSDHDPLVEAAATRQLRDRHVPGAMPLLLNKIDSQHQAVQEAAREALSEFSFANFLVGYEGLDDDARRTTGALVKKVDPHCAAGLLEEMESKSRKKRLRAVEMSEIMDLVSDVADGLILLLLEDEDHLVRAAAAETLRLCPTRDVQEALRLAASDSSNTVQMAAKGSLGAILRVDNAAEEPAVAEEVR